MTFVERLAKANVADIEQALGVEHPQRAALAEADARVSDRLSELDRATFSPVSQSDCIELGRKLAAGELKPKTVADRVSSAATKVNADGSSRRSLVLQGVRAQLVANEDRPEWSVRSLREGFVDVVADRVEQHVMQLMDAINHAPDSVRGPICSGLGMGLAIHRVDANNLSKHEFDAFSRIRELLGKCGMHGRNVAWSAFRADPDGPTLSLKDIADAFAGRDVDRFDVFGRLKPGQPEEFVEALLWSDSGLYLGAGDFSSAPDAVIKDPSTPIHVAPIVDPAGRDKEEYERRLAEYRRSWFWRNELNFLKEQNMAIDERTYRTLEARTRMKPSEVLESMKAEGAL